MSPKKICGVLTDEEKPCMICGSLVKNVEKFGELYQILDIYVHYFCVLLATNAMQRGSDQDGIQGFLYDDIKSLISTNKNSRCSFCNELGAAIICKYKRCCIRFHLPCGLKNGTMSQFKGYYYSYCWNHRPRQRIPDERECNIMKCAICLSDVDSTNSMRSIHAPCCKNWYHRDCIECFALSAGSLLKCPTCNNRPVFKKEMVTHGIYIPVRDASWEREPNAFSELGQPDRHCIARYCLCPKGTRHTKKGTCWGLVVCGYCGSNAIHAKCALLRSDTERWGCAVCVSPTTAHNNATNQLTTSTKRKLKSRDIRQGQGSAKKRRMSAKRRRLSAAGGKKLKIYPKDVKLKELYILLERLSPDVIKKYSFRL